MKSLIELGLAEGETIIYESEICSVACTVDYENYSSELKGRIDEITASYFNQWQFVISAYHKLYMLHTELNKQSDLNNENGISDYDTASIHAELDFKNLSYLLIVSMKSFLDLFACLADITLNQQIRPENELPDFYNFGKKKDSLKKLNTEFEELRNETKYPWIFILRESRNRILHRGYNIKPEFGVKRESDIKILIHKGNDYYTDVLTLKVGELFEDFARDMPIIEELVSNILLSHLDSLKAVNVSFRWNGSLAEYIYKETLPN